MILVQWHTFKIFYAPQQLKFSYRVYTPLDIARLFYREKANILKGERTLLYVQIQ